jgi:D-alanyl-D-alanine carboxypeptidase (penicillin-binding protein 5/6)
MKHFFALFLSFLLFLTFPIRASALDFTTYSAYINASAVSVETLNSETDSETDTITTVTEPDISAPSAILMDADTGTILYAKNENEERALASVTKIMTLLLTFEALDARTIHPDDEVTVSEHASGMGGSQVYLEVNETQTVETMIKCITVASANDAAVSMAEFLAGSEDAFVEQMNAKAAELGMNNTHFVNCCGLDVEGHYSTAYDIALMSRELTTKYPDIFNYTQIWMEDITHHTARGDSTFTLSNTNKLIKQYEYATGLKTGYTNTAKSCISATATKDDVHLIAVIMGADDSKQRNTDATTLLNWGFANCKIFADNNTDALPDIPVTGGKKSTLSITYQSDFRYLDTTGSGNTLQKTFELPESVTAPIEKDTVIGKATYYLGEQSVGEVSILAAETIDELTLKDAWLKLLYRIFFTPIDASA